MPTAEITDTRYATADNLAELPDGHALNVSAGKWRTGALIWHREGQYRVTVWRPRHHPASGRRMTEVTDVWVGTVADVLDVLPDSLQQL